MPKVEGIRAVNAALNGRKRKYRDASVITGYTASYALYVHENMEARHAPGRRAKYLEGPAREKRGILASIIRKTTKATGSLEKGLLMAGLRLQREGQLIVPVSGWDPVISPKNQGSGNLRGSAFTEVEVERG